MPTTILTPTLWLDDILLGQFFKGHFQTGLPGSDLSGHHYLALADELSTRQLARKILENGGRVDVFPKVQQLLIEIATTGVEAAITILMGSIPYQQWLDDRAGDALDIKEAVALAEDILRHDPETADRTVALDQLRRRCGVSEYAWDKKYLAQLQAKCDRTPASDPIEQLRLDLLALQQETDPIKRVFKRQEMSVTYRIKGHDLEKLSRQLHKQTKTPEAEWMSLEELFDAHVPGLEYLIPGMLPKADTVLLIADPKVGKSLLAYDAAFAVATGESRFLGEITQQGRVLIVQTDESMHSTKSRLLHRGFRREDSGNLQYIASWNISQMQKLEEKLETFRPALVIVDSLRRVSSGAEVSEDKAEVSDNISELRELLTRYGASGIIIHHAKKDPDATGVSRVRGSSAIAAATWGVWDLERIPKTKVVGGKKKAYYDPKCLERFLTITSRDTEGTRLRLELNPENNSWVNHGEDGITEEDLAESKSQSDAVLEILQAMAPLGLEAQEINNAVNLGRGIYSVLNRLLNRRQIGSRPSTEDKRRTVYYCHTSANLTDDTESTVTTGDTPPPPVSQLPVIEYAEDDTGIDVQRSITDRSQIDHTLIAPQENITPVIENSLELVTVPEVDHTSPVIGGGVGISCDSLNTNKIPPTVTLPIKPVAKVGDRVLIDSAPHTDGMGPYLVERVEGMLAKVEWFLKLLPLDKLTVVEASGNG